MKATVAVIILLSFTQEQAEAVGIPGPSGRAQGTAGPGDPALPPTGSVPPAALSGRSPLWKTSWAGCGNTNQQRAERSEFLLLSPALKFLQTWLSGQEGAIKASPWNRNRPFRISHVHMAGKPKLLLFVHSIFLGVPGAPTSGSWIRA